MAKKKTETEKSRAPMNGEKYLHAEVREQPIIDTLEENYMPYAMSVIVSRAIPEIDGFKPSHRKLLYMMYKMGLLTGARTKSANIVGSTMKLNPHGDAAIYDTMVRLSKGYEALLTPFVDGKGNFGKVYSRDMAWAAPRYTEAKLSAVCAELFRDIDKDTVDFVPNYDGTMNEPMLLPTTFPNVLVSANMGIAVGMASNICGFNLAEVCETTIALIQNPEHDLLTTLPAPDFPTGGEVLFSARELEQVYNTGRGGIRLRAKWRYVKSENLIEVYEIPYTTSAEVILDRIADLVKDGKLREISGARDESDLNGLKLAFDLKRGTDPDKLMAKLFRLTPLMDSFPCNFNILISGNPRVMGVREILVEWTAWRLECVKRRVYHDMMAQKDKLHLLLGLKKILLDIDKAISVIRNTEEEAEVVPNLMIAFGIDQVQAEYVAEIRLRNINREYILKRTQETEDLEKSIAELESTLASRKKLQNIIISELRQVSKKYGAPRKTTVVFAEDLPEDEPEDAVEDYPVSVFLSAEGYFKKITPQSLRMSGEQRVKEGDVISLSAEITNRAELLFVTDRQQIYKCRAADFAETKASQLGVYLPGELGMDEGERIMALIFPGDYSGSLLYFFENGKAARVELSAYATKTNRRKLTGAYSDRSPLVAVLHLTADTEVTVTSSDTRTLVFHTSLLVPKASRTAQGVAIMALKKQRSLVTARLLADAPLKNLSRYRVRKLPAAGQLLHTEDSGEEQLSLF